MKDIGTITLETERLILRKLTVADADEAYKNWTSDEQTAKYMTWDVHENVEVTRGLFKIWEEEYNNAYTYRFIVYSKEFKELIGTIDLVNKNIKEKTGEIGYFYGSKYWGNGYATEALDKVLNFLLNDVGFYLIEAKHFVTNKASGRVMEKCGMKYEATLRKRYFDKLINDRVDIKVYSKTKND